MQNIDLSHFAPYESAYCPDALLSEYAFSLCGGHCTGLFAVKDSEMLKDLVIDCISANVPYRVLGGMTNVLVSDSGYEGIILLNRKGMISQTECPDGSVLLKADSGVNMAALVKHCIQNALSGMEWASGLPGTVGGAGYGNAGAFGADTASVFDHGRFLDGAGRELLLGRDELGFGYRTSFLKQGRNLILLEAVFRLQPGNKADIASAANTYLEKRKAGQPYNERSLGSVFKNPAGYSAGKLIQDAGLKGTAFGSAAVSLKHANFITTTKGVKSGDYRDLITHIASVVEEKYGVVLEPEIEFLGF